MAEVEVAAKPDVVIKSLSPGDGKTFPEHGDTCEVSRSIDSGP
jgi:hypothetical protein